MNFEGANIASFSKLPSKVDTKKTTQINMNNKFKFWLFSIKNKIARERGGPQLPSQSSLLATEVLALFFLWTRMQMLPLILRSKSMMSGVLIVSTLSSFTWKSEWEEIGQEISRDELLLWPVFPFLSKKYLLFHLVLTPIIPTQQSRKNPHCNLPYSGHYTSLAHKRFT